MIRTYSNQSTQKLIIIKIKNQSNLGIFITRNNYNSINTLYPSIFESIYYKNQCLHNNINQNNIISSKTNKTETDKIRIESKSPEIQISPITIPIKTQTLIPRIRIPKDTVYIGNIQ